MTEYYANWPFDQQATSDEAKKKLIDHIKKTNRELGFYEWHADMMVKTVIGRYKLDGIIRQDEGVIDGIEYICRLVHDGIIRYSLRELYQRLSEEYIKAQTPSTSPFNNEFSRGVMIACDYWLNIKEKATDA